MQTTTSPNYKLIIFDCDGVLVDSELIFNRVLHGYLTDMGVELSYEQCCDLFIGKNKYAVEKYVHDLGIATHKNWIDGFYQKVYTVLAKEVTPIKGIKAVLLALRQQQLDFCVASNGAIEKMHITLGKIDVSPWFKDQMYSAYDIGDCKPAPDVFLHAAKVNGVPVTECVVIEDSASGLEAAKNAGMRCLAYCPEGADTHADLFGATAFEHMSELPQLLGL